MSEIKKKWDSIAREWITEWDGKDLEDWQIEERMDFVKLLRGSHILDLGCGPGKDLTFFKALRFRCVGVDHSKKILAFAENSVICASITELPFRDRVFDGVWSCSSLKYLQRSDLSGSLKEVKRVLKSKGIFFLSTEEGEGNTLRLVSKETFVVTLYSEQNLRSSLTSGGFKVVDMKRMQKWHKFINFLCKKDK